jgi:beta-glucosidase
MSVRELWETYLPPFKSALDAGVATFMNAFNSFNGVPSTGSTYLQRKILKGTLFVKLSVNCFFLSELHFIS